MISHLLAASLVAYFLSSVLYLANLHLRNRSIAGYGTAFAAVGFAVQTVRIAMQAAAHIAPHSNALESISFLAWAITGAYLFILWRTKLTAVGALALPLSVIAIVLSYRLQSSAWVFHGPLVAMHIMAISASLALFVLAFCGAVFYLVQNKLLKTKKFHGMFRRLPPLETVDTLAFHLAAIGFPLLTLSIVTGIVGAGTTHIASRGAGLKILAAALTWITYAAYLLAHGSAGWRGKRANWILCIGAALIAITAALHGFR